jgi:CheY-like chemotaxis protein
MSKESLPAVNYRISTDYGEINFEKPYASSSNAYNLFGSTLNICSEINRMATPDGMVIGNNLYQKINSFPSSLVSEYRCTLVGDYLVGGLKNPYPVYSIASIRQAQLGQDQAIKCSSESIDIPKEEISRIRNPSCSGNILLVDDDSDVLWTYKNLLEVEGYKVDAFSNPEYALKQFSQSEPSYYDLVLLDIRMPRLNGLQFFYRIKSIETDTKIIFISALDAAEELLSVLPGIKIDKHIIKKPVGREVFLERINMILSEPIT